MMTITRALIHTNTKVTKDDLHLDYGALISLINKWHTVFDELGLKAGDGYATYGYFNPEVVALIIAGGERGLVFHVVVNVATINSLVNQNTIKAVFRNIDTSTDIEPSSTSIDFLISDAHQRREHPNPVIISNRDTPFISGYTSGTTGEAKSYTHTHHSFLLGTLHLAKTRFTSSDVVASLGNVLHIALIGIQTLPILIVGAHIKYFHGPKHALIKHPDSGNYNKIAIPQGLMIDEIIDHEKWKDLDLSHIDEFITGGSSLDKGRMVEPLLAKGVKKIVSLYGCSEMGIVSALEVTKDTYKQQFSESNFPLIGDFFPFVDVKVDDSGVLKVKGECVAPSIFTEEGYFTPFDNVEIINGRWYVKGRVRRVGRVEDVLLDLTSIDYCVRQFHREGKSLFKSCFSFINRDKLYLAVDCDKVVQNTVVKEELSTYLADIIKKDVSIVDILYVTPAIPPGGIKPVWDMDKLLTLIES